MKKRRTISLGVLWTGFLCMLLSINTRSQAQQVNRDLAYAPPAMTEITIRATEQMPVPGFTQEARQFTVTGQVTAFDDGAPMPGVNVLVKGTLIGATTDPAGRYQLEALSGNDTLVFSFVGFQTLEVPIANRPVIDVTMEETVSTLDEMVVVGYGVRKRETLSGSVSSISGELLETAPVTNISNSLAGKIPGLVSMNSSGEPGYDGATILIRGSHTLGNNSPLVVIDGVPNRAGGMERLHPSEIENISVLKDASAAIYGAQAANGVILITTKRGRAGKPRLSLDVNQGFNQPTRVPEMADAATYLTMLNEISMYRGGEPLYTQERIDDHRNGTDPWRYPDTDWFAETLKPLSSQTNANMSISGGTDDVQYFVSAGALTEDGYYRNSATRYDQFNFRSNIDGQISKNIKIGFDIAGRIESRNFPTRSAGNIFRMVMRGKPHLPAYWPNGLPGPDIEYGDNPVVIGTSETGYNKDERNYFQSNLRLDLNIPAIEGLSLRGNASFDRYFQENRNWQTPWTLYTWDYETYDENGVPVLQPSPRGFSEPRLSQRFDRGQNILLNLVGTYQRELRNHSYSVLLGTEAQTFKNSFLNAFRRYYISKEIDELFAGGNEGLDNTGRSSQGARLNYFSRLNYGFQEKYLFEVVARYDGSYLFPEEGRYGFFPGFSAAWRLTEENFFRKNVPLFDELKLRSSWGRTGNDRIDEWQYLATYGFSAGYVFNGDERVPGLYQTRTANPEVTWEIANQFNVGVDGQLLNRQLAFEFDHFRYKRTDILWWRNASVPWTAGFSLPRENIGEVSSWGFDGTLTFRQGVSSDFFYEISLNGGYSRNKIDFWDEAPGAPDYQRSTGAPMNTGLYYQSIGVFQSEEEIARTPHWPGARPGDLIFEDVNGDGTINGLDRVRINKNDQPRFTGGLNLNATFKSFDLSMLFQGAAGAVQYVFTESGEIGNYLKEFAENRWTPQNPSTEYPRTFNRNDEYWTNQSNTYWLRPTDYIRLKNVQIGYQLPTRLTNRVGLSGLRLYASGFNLLTFDRLKLMDPEATSQSGQYYPQKRVYNIGLNVTF